MLSVRHDGSQKQRAPLAVLALWESQREAMPSSATQYDGLVVVAAAGVAARVLLELLVLVVVAQLLDDRRSTSAAVNSSDLLKIAASTALVLVLES